jgi:ribokinase
MNKLDFIALGDITTDAFIELDTDHAHVADGERHGSTGKKELHMSFGDKLPYKSVAVIRAVGNSPNASVSAARLGLASALISDIGDDQNGQECIEALQENSVVTDYITQHAGALTNYHYVLRYKEERTILIKHERYEYALPAFLPPKWLYLSSLSDNSLPHHHSIAQYLVDNPQVKLAFQPGTFQIKLGYENLKKLYAHTELFFCNKEEAQRILEKPNEVAMKNLLAGMHELGPRIAVITDGPRGAYTFDGSEYWRMPMYPDPAPPVDRTGAGDSFSSTFTAALALGKSIPEALSWGPINSMNVVQHIGAQKGLLTREELEKYCASAPADYRAEQL